MADRNDNPNLRAQGLINADARGLNNQLIQLEQPQGGNQPQPANPNDQQARAPEEPADDAGAYPGTANDPATARCFSQIQVNRFRIAARDPDLPTFPGVVHVNARATTFRYQVSAVDGVFCVTPNVANLFYKRDEHAFAQFRNHPEAPPIQNLFAPPRVSRLVPARPTLENWTRGLTAGAVPVNFNVGAPCAIIAIFSKLRTFSNRYEMYLDDPDTGVAAYGPNNYFEGFDFFHAMCGFPIELFNYPNQIPAAVRSEAQIDFLIHIIAIAAFKNFANDEHLRQFVERRLAAWNAATAQFEVTAENWRHLITPNAMMAVARTMSAYPKLRTMLLGCVIEQEGVGFAHTRQLLSYVGLASAHMVHLFLNSGEKTRAHIDIIILREALQYLQTFRRLTRTWGTSLRYLRVLEPGCTDLDINRWPNLAYVAYLRLSAGNAQAMAQYNINMANVTIRNAAMKLATPLPQDMLVGDVLARGFQDVVAQLGQMLADNMGIAGEALTPQALARLMAENPEPEAFELYTEVERATRNRARQVRENNAAARVVAPGGANANAGNV